MNVIAGSWLIASVCTVLQIVMSSAMRAVCGKRSLTHAPDSPCWRNLNIDAATGSVPCPEVIPVMRCPMRTESGSSVPRNWASFGL